MTSLPKNVASNGTRSIRFAYRTNTGAVPDQRLHLRIRKNASYVPSFLRCRIRQANPTETVRPSIQENSQSRNSSIRGREARQTATQAARNEPDDKQGKARDDNARTSRDKNRREGIRATRPDRNKTGSRYEPPPASTCSSAIERAASSASSGVSNTLPDTWT